MRQEIEHVYVENGAFYITSRTRLIKSGLRYSGKTGVFEMPFQEVFRLILWMILQWWRSF